MPSAISAALLAEATKVHQTTPWAWLFEIQATATTAFRITPYRTDVVIYEGASAPYTARTFEAFNGNPPNIRREIDGSLSEVSISIPNVSQDVMAVIDTNDVTGLNVRVLLVHTGNLGDTSNKTGLAVDEDYQVTRIGPITIETIGLTLGHWNLIRKQVPSARYNRTRCRHVFKGGWCAFPSSGVATKTGIVDGFDLEIVGLTVCDKGFSTPNGCKPHGALEQANGLPILHPRRFGAQPGIAKGAGV